VSEHAVRAVVIGASAGAIQALNQILPALPTGFALPILIVVHVPPDRRNALRTLYAKKCRIPVEEAEDKAPILPGTIVFAPPGYHLMVEPDETLSLSTEAPVHFSRPSIDVLFETAADAYGPALAGVILTGANEDGAAGLKAIAEMRGIALVQDPETADAYSMPAAALKLCPSAEVLALAQIAERLIALGGA
jgi:two-component system chemotaxis response regulator CheB